MENKPKKSWNPHFYSHSSVVYVLMHLDPSQLISFISDNTFKSENMLFPFRQTFTWFLRDAGPWPPRGFRLGRFILFEPLGDICIFEILIKLPYLWMNLDYVYLLDSFCGDPGSTLLYPYSFCISVYSWCYSDESLNLLCLCEGPRHPRSRFFLIRNLKVYIFKINYWS